jgi:hypothetical protein
MKQDTKARSGKKPGARFIAVGVVAFVYGLVILLINLTAPVETPETGIPSSIIVMFAGLALAWFGRHRRALAESGK